MQHRFLREGLFVGLLIFLVLSLGLVSISLYGNEFIPYSFTASAIESVLYR